MLLIKNSASGFHISNNGRKDVQEQGVKAIEDWRRLEAINKERLEK